MVRIMKNCYLTKKMRNEIFYIVGAMKKDFVVDCKIMYVFEKASRGMILCPSAKGLLRWSYFSEDGLEYTVCRVCFGSSDFGLHQYTYAPKYDPTLKSFNLTEDDHLYKIGPIKKALKQTRRPISLFGTTWTPPEWMKVRNATTVEFLSPNFRQIYSDYHVKILDAFKAEGVDVWGLTTGNEPISLYQFRASIPSLAMLPEEQREWVIESLGPTLRNANYSTNIILLDDMRVYALWWMDTVFRNPKASEYVLGIGLHWYFDNIISPSILDKVHEKYPNQEILYTETSINTIIKLTESKNAMEIDKTSDDNSKYGFDPSPPLLGLWRRAALYIQNIIENLNHWVTTYVDWNMSLNTDGGPNLVNLSCDAAVIINSTSDEFYKQSMFYAMGHFSKFIQPGSVIVDVQPVDLFQTSGNKYYGSDQLLNETIGSNIVFPTQTIFMDIKHVAALNPDGSRTVIFYNPKASPIEVTFHDPDRGYGNLILPPQSITSTVYW